MPLFTADAVILRTYKLAEADRIVVFLTRDRGKKRGVARGARRPRSRFGGALEPLTRARVAYFERERRELVSLNYAEVEQSPLAAPDARALGYAEYFAELLDEWAPEGDPNERLYRLGASMVDAFAADVPVDPLVRYFEYWLLRLQGVYPSYATCHRCGTALERQEPGGAVLGPGGLGLVCLDCAAREDGDEVITAELSRETLSFLRMAGVVSPQAMTALPFSPTVDRELDRLHRRLLVTHLEKELKSARVLRDLRR